MSAPSMSSELSIELEQILHSYQLLESFLPNRGNLADRAHADQLMGSLLGLLNGRLAAAIDELHSVSQTVHVRAA